MSVPAGSGVTAALLTMLRTAIGQSVPWGDGTRPTLVDENKPYGILYPVPGGQNWGGLSNPDANGEFYYQLSCCGRRRDQAEVLRDKARATMIARSASGAFQVDWPVMLNGLVVIQRHQSEQGGLITDGAPPLEWFTFHDRYCITVSQA